MSEKEKSKSAEVSRRRFLRDAGLFVGGAASLSIGSLAFTGHITAPDCQAASYQVNAEYIGECVCPSCDARLPHPRGVPCRTINCPKCGANMARGTA